MKILKKYKPFSNSVRHKIIIDKSLLIKNNNLTKNLNYAFKKQYGRCKIYGNITVRHKGAKTKTLSKKKISNSQNIQGLTIGTLHDSHSSSFASLKFDLNRKKFFYDTSLLNEYPGSLTEYNSKSKELKLGYRTQLKNIPTGSFVCLINNPNSKSSEFIKSAGSTGQIINKTLKNSTIKLPSGKTKLFKNNSIASIGSISNNQHKLQVLGTAGKNRHLGKRPSVRGIAMNPVDHPHGGRTNGGKPSVTPWGLPTKCKFKLKRRA